MQLESFLHDMFKLPIVSTYGSVFPFGILSSRNTRIARKYREIGVEVGIRTLHC